MSERESKMETSNEELKSTVREVYGKIAETGKSACCASTSCCGTTEFTFSEDYSSKKGYVPEADLGLGCGIPTDVAKIQPGETVLDLGSGAGNDVFVARGLVGETGKVIGIDMTSAMIARAEVNKKKMGYENVEFRLGEIEAMPVESNSIDVAVSNCVLNLVPDKARAFAELYRVLKPGGRFAVSDIVLSGTLPPAVKQAAEMYAGCVSGALQQEEYLAVARRVGFQEVTVKIERAMPLSDELLSAYLSKEDILVYRQSGSTVKSITVHAVKPMCKCGERGDGCC